MFHPVAQTKDHSYLAQGKDGYVFSWVKATEGMTYTDPKFYTNIEGGISEDLIMGAYHFARPDNNTAQQDATNFLNVSSAYIGTGFLPRRKRNHLRQPAPN